MRHRGWVGPAQVRHRPDRFLLRLRPASAGWGCLRPADVGGDRKHALREHRPGCDRGQSSGVGTWSGADTARLVPEQRTALRGIPHLHYPNRSHR